MNDLILSLQITALGMGLVFGAILLLWGMMTLLVKLPSIEKNSAPDSPPGKASAPADDLAAIAALTVALALAEKSASYARALREPPTALVSAWQLEMRARQSSEKGNFRRR